MQIKIWHEKYFIYIQTDTTTYYDDDEYLYVIENNSNCCYLCDNIISIMPFIKIKNVSAINNIGAH